MGIPNRLAAEYPIRCLELIKSVESYARDRKLLGSFSLLAAAAVLTIPFERAKTKHFLHRAVDDPMTKLVDGLDKVKFVKAPFWGGREPVDWRQSHIVANVNSVEQWIARDGKHPFARDAQDFLPKKTASEVLRIIRNALAHGNIIYLNKDGQEREGDMLHHLAFLSRYEEDDGQRAKSESYRLVITTEDGFLEFVKLWAEWIGYQAIDDRQVQAS